VSALVAHLARLGGVIISPRRTLRRALWQGEASLWEIWPWMLVVTAAVAPTGAGRAVLVGRVAALDGVLLFFNLVASRMVAPLIGVLVAAILLTLVSRLAPGAPKATFDAALDAVGLTLVPFLLLAAAGSLLYALGLELWFMPHRRFAVPGTAGAVRLAVAFGWPLALYGFLIWEVWTRRGAVAESGHDRDGAEQGGAGQGAGAGQAGQLGG